MSDHKKRIDTLLVLIAGSPISGDVSYTNIKGEFAEVSKVKRISYKNRYRLLQVLHSTRALDTSLKVFTAIKGYGDGHSLGNYLHNLSNPPTRSLNPLPAHRAQHYQKNIVMIRNRFMHQAGTYPNGDEEIRKLLSEMHDCLATVLVL